MTMHVVMGDGELPGKELDALLQDMHRKAIAADDPFWFLVQGKAEPTATDTRMMKWIIDNDIYYEMITDGSEADIYTAHQNRYVVKRLAPKVVSLMQEVPDEGEAAQLLALFAADDPDAEEDRWLNDVIQAVSDAGYKVLAMNDGMQEIKIVTVEDDDEGEVAEVVPLKKAAAKKVAAKPPVEDAEVPSEGGYTREQLEEMDLDGLKAVAAKLGITLPPRTRMPTYVEAILGNTKDDEVEIVDGDGEQQELPLEENVHVGITSTVSSTASGNTTSYLTSLASAAMLIVVYNGSVVSRAITEEEARQLIQR